MNKTLVAVIGPIAVVRSYVWNAGLTPDKIRLVVRSLKPAKVWDWTELAATVSVKVTGVPLFILSRP